MTGLSRHYSPGIHAKWTRDSVENTWMCNERTRDDVERFTTSFVIRENFSDTPKFVAEARKSTAHVRRVRATALDWRTPKSIVINGSWIRYKYVCTYAYAYARKRATRIYTCKYMCASSFYICEWRTSVNDTRAHVRYVEVTETNWSQGSTESAEFIVMTETIWVYIFAYTWCPKERSVAFTSRMIFARERQLILSYWNIILKRHERRKTLYLVRWVISRWKDIRNREGEFTRKYSTVSLI